MNDKEVKKEVKDLLRKKGGEMEWLELIEIILKMKGCLSESHAIIVDMQAEKILKIDKLKVRLL
ncbi:hypothetical protein KW799_00590 [Candidatus Parcubacteria bacterium]|nr:hypothetical protein [Candidatus Parcubacteria bacterium]